MSTMPQKQRSSLSALALRDHTTFQNYKDPAFVEAVNRAANLKVLSAIKSGRLRIVRPPGQPTARYTPRMDVVEDPSSSRIVAMLEIPGITGDDIQISISDGAFTVFGERNAPYPTSITDPLPRDPISVADNISSGKMMDIDDEAAAISRRKVYHQELLFGTFSRTVPIPKGLKTSDIVANLRDGMLIVTYPKQPYRDATVPESKANIDVKPIKVASHTTSTNTPSPPMPMLAAGTASQ